MSGIVSGAVLGSACCWGGCGARGGGAGVLELESRQSFDTHNIVNALGRRPSAKVACDAAWGSVARKLLVGCSPNATDVGQTLPLFRRHLQQGDFAGMDPCATAWTFCQELARDGEYERADRHLVSQRYGNNACESAVGAPPRVGRKVSAW